MWAGWDPVLARHWPGRWLALAARTPAVVAVAGLGVKVAWSDEELERLGVPVVTLPGLGHNAHVESPQRCVALLEAYHR